MSHMGKTRPLVQTPELIFQHTTKIQHRLCDSGARLRKGFQQLWDHLVIVVDLQLHLGNNMKQNDNNNSIVTYCDSIQQDSGQAQDAQGKKIKKATTCFGLRSGSYYHVFQ